jgi:DNA mismatch repair protein MutS2
MIFPANFEVKVGFDRIRAVLEEHCLSDMGREKVGQIKFLTDFGTISKKLRSTEEFRQILLSVRNFPSQDYFDLRSELRRLAVAGTWIEVDKLAELRCSLITLHDIMRYFHAPESEQYPELKALAEQVFFDPVLIKSTDKILDDKGQIKDSASPELKKIRQELGRRQQQVGVRIRQIYLELKKDGVTSTGAEITIRNGRSVIPLPAANKRRIRGFIHDESATGQTVYIEPEEIFEINNEIRELESAEKREIIRILTEFSDLLRPGIPALIIAYDVLAELDFIRAKASFAIRIKAFPQKIGKKPSVDLRKAVNPNLFLAGQDKGKKVVPLDIRLGGDTRIMVISGPNAGGKSVCLKTAGILQYMLQCGLLIPAGDDSEPGIFKHIFIEIGDEQSIENDLSTYSSHLKNISHLLKTADKQTLFLIDEFGSGTEPQSGGAIAEAALEALAKTGATGVVTTHYLNLKLLAGRVEGVINGAMLFDTKEMLPLFKLSPGKPGSSFAYEIAEQIGFPAEILKNAAEKTGMPALDFEHQLQELETERRGLEKDKAEFSLADELLSRLIERYTKKTEDLESSRKEILKRAHEEATELLNNSNKLIENTIRAIKESQADQAKTQEARENLKRRSEEVKRTRPWDPAPEPPENKPFRGITKTYISRETAQQQKAPIVKGGFAKIRGQNRIYQIEEIKGNMCLIVRDNLKLTIALDRLEGSEKGFDQTSGKDTQHVVKSIAAELNQKLSEFKTSMDVRGARAEEVHPLIQKFIDDAILLDVAEVHILHGKGQGVLRQVVHDYVKSVKEIKSFHDEAPERGGSGITVVKFR